jgi:hypothetical protein
MQHKSFELQVVGVSLACRFYSSIQRNGMTARDRGGIGRHAGLRSQWANACGGSSPLDRTILCLVVDVSESL